MSAASLAHEEEFWRGASPDGRARYRDATIIGQGAYSVVARATDTATGTTVAIKRISEVFYDAHEAKKVLREIRLLRDFEHPNIISLKALVPPTSMETFNDMFMVTEFMDGDLRRLIKSKQPVDAETTRSYMAQLLAGLQHVHAVHGIHRDLKPANVLLSSGGRLKLCDFGLARTVAPSAGARRTLGEEVEREGADPSVPPPLKPQMTNYVVTRWYRAPEVILQEPYNGAIDIWAVGCIFKELLELVPASRFRTGALFPGRYCIPFSFDDDHRHRQRHDQLAVICRVLGSPTKGEMRWASPKALAELEAVFGALRDTGHEERQARVALLSSDACARCRKGGGGGGAGGARALAKQPAAHAGMHA